MPASFIKLFKEYRNCAGAEKNKLQYLLAAYLEQMLVAERDDDLFASLHRTPAALQVL